MAAFTNLRYRLKSLSALSILVIVNVAIFLLLRLLGIIAIIGGWDINTVVDQLALPSDMQSLAYRPWTLLSYMVTHYAPFHILFNLITLYCFGKLLLWRCSPSQLVWLYIYGGIAGAIFYIVGALSFATVGGWLLGASASVIAIVIATAMLMPDFRVSLLLLGSVKLKWIAIAAVILFALGLVGDNAGAHIAHFGGIVMGCLFGFLYNHGVDITRPARRIYDAIARLLRRAFGHGNNAPRKARFKFRKKATSGSATPAASADDDRRNLDAILDKIKHSGYTALSPDERRQLFDISRRIK